MQFDEKSGLLYREEKLDLSIIREQSFYKNLKFTERDIFLDIGAHIGSTTKLAVDCGVGDVISVEPDWDNFRMLVVNTKKLSKVHPIRAAVVKKSHDLPYVRLFLNSGKSGASHSLVDIKGREFEFVPATTFQSLLTTFKPTLIKIDIEGYEYELMKEIAFCPDFVRAIVVELHTTRKQWAEEYVPRFRTLMDVNFTAFNRDRIIHQGAFGKECLWYRK